MSKQYKLLYITEGCYVWFSIKDHYIECFWPKYDKKASRNKGSIEEMELLLSTILHFYSKKLDITAPDLHVSKNHFEIVEVEDEDKNV